MSLPWLDQWNTRRRGAFALLVGACCLAIGVLAQWRLDSKGADALALLAYAGAGVLFAATFGGITLERPWDSSSGGRSAVDRLWRSWYVIAGFMGVALLGCLDFGGNRFRPLGIVLWGGGVTLCLAYLFLSEPPVALSRWLESVAAKGPVSISRMAVALALVTCVAAVLRLYQLEAIPADIGWDLPYNYTDALAVLNGEHPIFFPANQGREGLFFYLIALVARFSPLGHFSIKLTSALIGIATIPAIYLLGRRLFDSTVGLTAACLLAFNRWHLVLSRSGFRVILLPLFVILALHVIVRAMQSNRVFDFALSGVVLGLGLYTYTSFIFAVPAMYAGLAVHAWRMGRPHWRAQLRLLTLLTLFLLVVYAPLLRYALENPDQYLQRIGLQRRLLLADPGREQMTLPLLMENVRTSLLMFHVHGDHNVRFNVPFARHLGFVSGILLVLGLGVVIRRWREGGNTLLGIALLALIVPMTLAMFPHEMPNIFRASGTIGPALIIGSVSLVALARKVREIALTYPVCDWRTRLRISAGDQAFELVHTTGRRGALLLAPAAVIALLLAVELRETRQFYFRDLVSVLPDRHNVSIAKEMAAQMQTYGDLSRCFVKVWPHWFDGRALQTYVRRQYDAQWSPEFSELIPDAPPLSKIADGALILLHPSDTAGLEQLTALFPKHATVVHYLPDDVPAFVSVYVER